MRSSARVLFFNRKMTKILLLCNKGDPNEDPWWITVGGGVQPGESFEFAAVREIKEETGVTVQQQTLRENFIGVRQATHIYRNREAQHFEQYYYVTVALNTPDIASFTDEEKQVIKEIRWWTKEELVRTTDTIWPSNLLDLWDGAESLQKEGKHLNMPVQKQNCIDYVPSLLAAPHMH
ncbi:NUDIX hydrolase [Bombiscardovia coagulans]|uniref:NUDIX hydrolase n=1 Tax=Bombiscardovia coagulans TaxID=686666 RepID=A0A261EVF6_9BIFI|nr:NUDIX domain-containing protein [Bombiscardovia coagulans]OZG50854.1 NUDIX hydrolase [Bombiscardovia coagulans]